MAQDILTSYESLSKTHLGFPVGKVFEAQDPCQDETTMFSYSLHDQYLSDSRRYDDKESADSSETASLATPHLERCRVQIFIFKGEFRPWPSRTENGFKW